MFCQEAKDLITTHQIRNVLRVYSNELKRRTRFSQNGSQAPRQPNDFVEISVEARRKQMVSNMSDHLISQITNENPQVKAYDLHSDHNGSQISAKNITPDR